MNIQTKWSRVDITELRRLVRRLIPHLDWRCNGLGVLQAYVSEGDVEETRVHIWHPSLEKEGIRDSGQLHDHRFNLVSTVLCGRMVHIEYDLLARPDGPFRAYPVVHAREAMRSSKTFDGQVSAEAERHHATTRQMVFGAGSRYTFPKGRFHGTNVDGLVVTLVSKYEQVDRPARILAPHDKQPVHAFADPLPRKRWKHLLDLAVKALEDLADE